MVDPTDHREYAHAIAPAFLRYYWGQRLVGGLIGLPCDLIAEGTQRGMLARAPLWSEVPDDALARVGQDRDLPRWPGESSPTYAVRLQKAWDTWAFSGSYYGLQNQFTEFGVTGTPVEQNIDGWDWDGDTTWWSRAWVVVTNHGWISAGVLGDPLTLGQAGLTLGSNATIAEVEAMRKIVRSMKKATSYVQYIIVVIDSGSWSPPPDGTWDQWENRDAGAIYISG